MKTNHVGRRLVSIHSLPSLLAVIVILAVEIGFGMLMVSRLGQTSSAGTPNPPEGMSVNVSDFQP